MRCGFPFSVVPFSDFRVFPFSVFRFWGFSVFHFPFSVFQVFQFSVFWVSAFRRSEVVVFIGCAGDRRKIFSLNSKTKAPPNESERFENGAAKALPKRQKIIQISSEHQKLCSRLSGASRT